MLTNCSDQSFGSSVKTERQSRFDLYHIPLWVEACETLVSLKTLNFPTHINQNNKYADPENKEGVRQLVRIMNLWLNDPRNPLHESDKASQEGQSLGRLIFDYALLESPKMHPLFLPEHDAGRGFLLDDTLIKRDWEEVAGAPIPNSFYALFRAMEEEIAAKRQAHRAKRRAIVEGKKPVTESALKDVSPREDNSACGQRGRTRT
jgi:hypothetical protein